jgi:hypothetical protein
MLTLNIIVRLVIAKDHRSHPAVELQCRQDLAADAPR